MRLLAPAIALLLLATSAASLQQTREEYRYTHPVGLFEDFGQSVAIAGGLAAAGTERIDAVWLFRDQGDWQPEVIASPSSDEYSGFGGTVALQGTMLVVGAPLEDFDSLNTGAVHWIDVSGVPRVVATVGTQESGAWQYLGSSLAFSGSVAVAGAPYHTNYTAPWPDGSNLGMAVVMKMFKGHVRALDLSNPQPEGGARFGAAVATDGRFVAVAAPGAEGGAGRTWVYDIAHPVLPKAKLLYSMPGSPASGTAMVAADGLLAIQIDGVVRILDVASGTETARLDPRIAGTGPLDTECTTTPTGQTSCTQIGGVHPTFVGGYSAFDFTGDRMVAATGGALHDWQAGPQGWTLDVVLLQELDHNAAVSLRFDGERVMVGDGVDTVIILRLAAIL